MVEKLKLGYAQPLVEHFWDISARKALSLLSLQVQVRNKLVYADLDKQILSDVREVRS